MRDTLLVGEIHHGQPAFVSAVSRSDVASNEIVAGGLSMPRSPRWYRDRLWVCNSGTGEFGTVDLARWIWPAAPLSRSPSAPATCAVWRPAAPFR